MLTSTTVPGQPAGAAPFAGPWPTACVPSPGPIEVRGPEHDLVIHVPSGWHDVTEYRWFHERDGESVTLHRHAAGDAVDAATECLTRVTERRCAAVPGSEPGPIQASSIASHPAARRRIDPPEDLADVLPVLRYLAWTPDAASCVLLVHAAPAALREAEAHFDSIAGSLRRGGPRRGSNAGGEADDGRKFVSAAGVSFALPAQLRRPATWGFRGDGDAGVVSVSVIPEPLAIGPPPAAVWTMPELGEPEPADLVEPITTSVGGGRGVRRTQDGPAGPRTQRMADVIADDGLRLVLHLAGGDPARTDTMWTAWTRAVVRRADAAAVPRPGAAPAPATEEGS